MAVEQAVASGSVAVSAVSAVPAPEKSLLRFSTAGSVDDGKSTLIGRLLYESRGVYEDQLASIEKSGLNRSSGPLDFSLLTDGLRAEREQGITIDVAYRYFSTARRKFIIADTPGHEQYTRNMATGASTAHLAIVLIDARKGVLPQSKRHAYIASLLGIPRVVVAVNKMDLVDFRREVFEAIRNRFRGICAHPGLSRDVLHTHERAGGRQRSRAQRAHAVVSREHASRLSGDGAVGGRGRGRGLPVAGAVRDSAFARFSRLRRTDRVGKHSAGGRGACSAIGPRQRASRRSPLTTGPLDEAFAPMSITLTLDHEIDVSRGNMIVRAEEEPPVVARAFDATLVWMNDAPLEPGRSYLLKHTTRQVRATVRNVRSRIDVNTLEQEAARDLKLNEIGVGDHRRAAPGLLRSVPGESVHRRVHSDRPVLQRHAGGGHDSKRDLRTISIVGP